MSVFSLFKKQVEAAPEKKRIVFPESDDLRVLTAVSNLNKDGIIEPILIGKKEDVEKLAADNNLDIEGVKIYDQNNYADLDEMAEAFVKARRKDTSIAEAKAKLAKGNYFGTMLVKMGLADGMVSGAAHSTANTVLPALQLIHAAKGMHRVSGAFVMEKGDERYIFADCAININPDEETLAEIGYQSALTAKMADIDPKVAAIVDIYNNVHLDYHKTFENYVNAKLNVTRTQTSDDYFIANYDQKDILAKEKKVSPAKMQTFSETDHNADYFIGDEYLESQNEKIMKIADIKLPGIHNLQNSLVAISISKIMGADNDDIVAVLSTFAGAKHRLQYVTTLDGRKVYNDSKSTNIEAATVAIPAFKEPEVLIAGGLDRGFLFDDLVPLFKKHVKAIVLYGETKYLLADAARKAGIKDIVIVNTLQEAVPRAYELTEPGDVLLFSPACASWDQFRTFEERGDYFVRFVKELKTK